MIKTSVGELVRKAENDYISGTTRISKYVDHSMYETIEKIYAYLNSKHISGETDSLGRDKPFFNIVKASANIWYRATDIDRRHIKLRATNTTEWINSFLFNIAVQNWMRKERFSSFLNEWGRVLSRFGSAVPKFVRNSKGLHLSVTPWNVLIVDGVDFKAAPNIEIIELSEAQLYRRVNTHGYDADQVNNLVYAFTTRETVGKQKKDNKSDFIKLYEVHGEMPLSFLTNEEDDVNEYVQQMHVISFVGTKKGRQTEYEDFTLVSGKEDKEPSMITHLIKEDGRTLAIGSVENLFESQWMQNHSVKQIKDQLDIASRLIFQTSDPNYLGRNVLSAIETGDILVHGPQQPLTQVNNQSHDIVGLQNFAVQWKSLGNEINGISEAMLGAQPKSGTAWRQTEATLSESHSLFELMTENKGFYIEEMMREWIIPYVKEKMLDNTDEIAATLESYDLNRIDSIYLKNKSAKLMNKKMVDDILSGKFFDVDLPSPEEQQAVQGDIMSGLQEGLTNLGNERFFTPSDMNKNSWKEQFDGVEEDLEIDVTGESQNVQEMLQTLDTALKISVTPGFEQNEKGKMIVGKILELTGAMSPLEYASVPPQQPQGGGGSNVPDVKGGQEDDKVKQRNI